MLTILAITLTSQAACEDPARLIQEAAEALIGGRFDDVGELVHGAESAYGCSGLADRESLARLFVLQGAWMSLEGDHEDAATAFSAAHWVGPEVWYEELGADLREEYEAALGQDHAAGEIRLSDAPLPDMDTALDGAILSFPTPAPPGPHLVQLIDADGTAHFARLVLLPPGTTVTVEQKATAEPRQLPPPETTATPRSPTFLVAGGTSALLAAGAFALSRVAEGQMSDASTTEELDAAFQRQQVFGYSTYGLMAVAAVGVTLHFTLK